MRDVRDVRRDDLEASDSSASSGRAAEDLQASGEMEKMMRWKRLILFPFNITTCAGILHFIR